MNTLRSLISAIRADPANDAVRLAAADAWQEAGEVERAEFVRVQVELAKMEARHRRDCTGSITAAVESKPLRQLEWELLARFGKPLLRELMGDETDWAATVSRSPPLHLHAIDRGTGREVAVLSFARGFISRLACDWSSWSRHGDGICEAHPVTAVELNGQLGFAYSMSDHPAFVATARVAGLAVKADEVDSAAAGSTGAGPRAIQTALLGNRWPGVAFTLPPAGASWATGTATPIEDLRRLQSGLWTTHRRTR